MAGSHTSPSARDSVTDPVPLAFVPATAGGPERLAGRVDEHLARFAENMPHPPARNRRKGMR